MPATVKTGQPYGLLGGCSDIACLPGWAGSLVEAGAEAGDGPDDKFDLIVASEFLYYFGGDDLLAVIDLCHTALHPGGTLLAVHWRHLVAEYPRSGDSVHEALAERPGLALAARHTEPDFIAEAYQRGETAISVAQSTGLV